MKKTPVQGRAKRAGNGVTKQARVARETAPPPEDRTHPVLIPLPVATIDRINKAVLVPGSKFNFNTYVEAAVADRLAHEERQPDKAGRDGSLALVMVK